MLEVPVRNVSGDRRLQALVTGIRAGDVVEFTFVYGDPDLAVELVLPAPAFREFCVENGCFVSASDQQLRAQAQPLVGPIEVFTAASDTELQP